jgi:hypothetical protein
MPVGAPIPVGAPMPGEVVEYDAERGLGVVKATGAMVGGGAPTRYSFHCTAIAGGSRLIEPGTAVTFVLAPGLGGLFEARYVTPIV